MRIPFIAGNWKMFKTVQDAVVFVKELKISVKDIADVEIVVAPPFTAVHAVAEAARNSNIGVAAQDVYWEREGAFTGEVSASMLEDCGVRYVIVGHSERRNVYGESDALIARRLAMAIENGLTPVLCIGEDLRVREAGHVARFLADQVKAIVSPAIESGDIIIAYEPIWAIGTGRNATGMMCAETVASIRDAVIRFWPPRHANAAILYGGSVTPENIADLWSNGGIDGFLVGGASLDSSKFVAIYEQMRPA